MGFFVEDMKKNIFYQARYAIDLYACPINIACERYVHSCRKELEKKGYTQDMIRHQMHEYLDFYKLADTDPVCRKLWNGAV